MSDEPQTCRCGAGLPMLQCGNCFRQYFAADEYGPVSQAIATAEARGAQIQRKMDAEIVRATAPEIARRLIYHKTQGTLTETQAEIIVLDLTAAILGGSYPGAGFEGRWTGTFNAKTGAKIWLDGRPMFVVIAGLEDSRVSQENPDPRWRRCWQEVIRRMNLDLDADIPGLKGEP